MIDGLPSGLVARHPVVEDHPRVLAVLDKWWSGLKGEAGALERSLLLPRLYFQHFTTTSFVAEDTRGELAAFLVGFRSQTEPETAYIHFVGVDPALQGQGIGQALYQAFFALVGKQGCRVVHCITSPENAGSQAFHARLGFTVSEVVPDYDGPGLARVTFSRPVAEGQGRRLRILDDVLVLEHHAELDTAGHDDWVALVRAAEGLTVIRTADGAAPGKERWAALYDADPDHGLDEPGLLAAVLTPLARAGLPVFAASTYHADLVLVPEERKDRAISALRAAGFTVG